MINTEDYSVPRTPGMLPKSSAKHFFKMADDMAQEVESKVSLGSDSTLYQILLFVTIYKKSI